MVNLIRVKEYNEEGASGVGVEEDEKEERQREREREITLSMEFFSLSNFIYECNRNS